MASYKHWVTAMTRPRCGEQAVEEKRKADDISAVLYPNDATEYGKELRLKQQFFFVSASIQVRFLARRPLRMYARMRVSRRQLPSSGFSHVQDLLNGSRGVSECATFSHGN